MIDIREVVRTYDDDKVLLVTDFNPSIVADEIIKTIELFQKHVNDKSDLFYTSIKDVFGLDIKNNDFHKILWENWIKFMADIEVLDIGTRWGNNTHTLLSPEDDIAYLKKII